VLCKGTLLRMRLAIVCVVCYLAKCDFSKERRSSLRMILGSKHVGAIFKCFNVKFYVCALVGVLIKVILQNARCYNKDRNAGIFITSKVFSF